MCLYKIIFSSLSIDPLQLPLSIQFCAFFSFLILGQPFQFDRIIFLSALPKMYCRSSFLYQNTHPLFYVVIFFHFYYFQQFCKRKNLFCRQLQPIQVQIFSQFQKLTKLIQKRNARQFQNNSRFRGQHKCLCVTLNEYKLHIIELNHTLLGDYESRSCLWGHPDMALPDGE